MARTLGFDLMVNFNLPYFSRNPVEFWQRWHISLSQWFQDYLYFPLAMRYMRRGGWASKYKAHIISFLLIGLWHGANWTFIVFGLYWGLIIAGFLYFQERRAESGEEATPTRWGTVLSVAVTFIIACVGWVLFRAPSLGAAASVMAGLFRATGANAVLRPDVADASSLWVLVAGLWIVECCYRLAPQLLAGLTATPARRLVIRHALLVIIVVVYLASQQHKILPFIYFQF